ncbi:protein DpdG [Amycolatopsis sp. NPDC051106]|uniref:protein DpdG n=1 Tax=unclassified Amycolatopsis TaxID=2618356 RepID=UPI0034354A90
MLDFLDTHARASAQALLVVCRCLASQAKGQDSDDLREALQPGSLVKPTDLRSGMLGPALAVGKGLGFIESSEGKPPLWTLSKAVDRRTLEDSSDSTRAFYGSVLHTLGTRAVAAAESGDKVSDIALGFVWLAAQDPLEPISTNWGERAEDSIIKAGLDSEINNGTQWIPFCRWATSLGLAVESSLSSRRSFLIPDCSGAIRRILPRLPRSLPAEQWLRQVYSALPVLGDPQLTKLVPGLPTRQASVVSGSLALALHKLARAGLIELIPSEDAVDAVLVRLGNQSKRVSKVRILEEAA